MKRLWALALLAGVGCSEPDPAPAPSPTPPLDVGLAAHVHTAPAVWAKRPKPIEALAFRGSQLVIAADVVGLFDLCACPGAQRRTYEPPRPPAKHARRRLAIDAKQDRLLVAGAEQPVRAYGLDRAKLLQEYPTSALGGWQVRLSGTSPLVMDADGHLKRFSAQGKLEWCYPPCEEDEDWLEAYDLSQDGKWALVALNQGRIVIVDAVTGKAEKLLAAVEDPRLALLVPGAAIVGAANGSLQRIETATRRQAWEVHLPGKPTVSARDPQGARLAIACGGKTVHLIDAANGKTTRTLTLGAEATALAFTPDGKLLASGDASGGVQLHRRLGD